ncbi:MAG: RNA 3'-terminal phosphate cyclase [Armatimonadetes bacterium]|nr:RNA 3'-terminal phosphate cyclase [Armatimonadota bacterium]
MLIIDGSYGEGGGQVLRTSLSLAAITGTDLRLTSIRAGRKQPGLAAQHLTCVRAAAEVCGAKVEGDRTGSQELTFRPSAPRAGQYVFDVADIRPSAGSVNLILQTVLPILARCDGPSQVILRGGTHVPWSPTFEYVRDVFLPAIARFGVRAEVDLSKAGFYPRGNGEEVLRVQPSPEWMAADLTRALGEPRCRLLSRTTRLPQHVGERQMKAMRSALGGVNVVQETLDEMPGIAPGTTAIAETEPGMGGWASGSALGAKGKPAEKVGHEAAQALAGFLASGGVVDLHLADQVLLYAALAEGTTAMAVEAVTEHTRTNLWVIEQFLGPRFAVTEADDEPPIITARPSP